MKQIEFLDVTFGYESGIVVENLNFKINQGDFLFIVGENGSGKSTLVKGILSLLKPISGKIIFEDRLKRNQIGYFPQQANIRDDFPASTFEIILSGLLNTKKNKIFYTKKDKEDAINKMELLDILNLKNKSFSTLSGGQKQRVLLARALCSASKMLILDEPVSNLDPVVTAEFYQLLNKINKETDLTIMMVSHDMDATIKYAKQILHLGEKENFFGTTEEYLNSGLGKKFTEGGNL